MTYVRLILIKIYFGHDYDRDVILRSEKDRAEAERGIALFLGDILREYNPPFRFLDFRDDDRLVMEIEVKPDCWEVLKGYLNTFYHIQSSLSASMPVEIFMTPAD